MPAFKVQLEIGAGETFRWTARWRTGASREAAVPVDLTDWSGRLQVRGTVQSPDVLLELSTDGGGITLGADGAIELYLSHTDTAALTWQQGVFHLELTAPNGDVFRKLAGAVRVSPEIVRDA